VLPLPVLVVVALAWIAWRCIRLGERVFIRDRSAGWLRLVALVALSYGVPAVLAGRWWSAPLLVVGGDAVRCMGCLPALRAASMPRRTRPAVVDNVVPIRPS
jgi:hypothetical protein